MVANSGTVLVAGFAGPVAGKQLEKQIIPSCSADITRSCSLIMASKEDTVGKVFKSGATVCTAFDLGWLRVWIITWSIRGILS